MRFNLAVVLGLVLLAGGSPVADGRDADQAQTVLDHAIHAQGGLDQLAKTQLMVRSAKGTMQLFGQDLPFSDETTLQLPERWRMKLTSGPAGQQTEIMLVISGDRGWQSLRGQVTEIDRQRLGELREEVYALWVTTLVPLKKEAGFVLTTLSDARVDDQPASCLNVAQRGHADIKLFFNKQNGLLVKMEHRTREAGLNVLKEYTYADYQVFEGVRLPAKLVELANGKKLTDVSRISYKFLDQVDASTFAKP
jgi:hypothetical protein